VTAPIRCCAVLSTSGIPLEGDKLVRITYMDESGSSRRDPIVVEAGVIIHGDDQVIPVEEHLEGLVEKHIPEDKREGFYFHAAETVFSVTRLNGQTSDAMRFSMTLWRPQSNSACQFVLAS
jgi:hypothetical protein